MKLRESSELACELRELRRWTCMLDEVQHTTAIFQMLQETSLTQVRALIDVLRRREAEFTIVYSAVPKLSPLPQNWTDRKQSSSPNSVTSCTSGTALSSNTLIPRSTTPLYNSASQSKESIISPPTRLSVHSPSFEPSILLPPPGFPHPRPHLFHAHRSQSPVLPLQVPISSGDIGTRATAQLHLVHLTTVPPPRTAPHHKRLRKIPQYPRDASDPRWLLKWLQSLRLHKYEPQLQGLTPYELLALEDKEDVLIQRGIHSLGARNKLIVAFGDARRQLAAEAEAEKK